MADLWRLGPHPTGIYWNIFLEFDTLGEPEAGPYSDPPLPVSPYKANIIVEA